MKKLIIFTALFVSIFISIQQNETDLFAERKICLSSDEAKLGEIINRYRKSRGLKEIPLSVSLSKVAKTHVRDLMQNGPGRGRCNTHSWSKGSDKWKGCCYTSDHRKASCMWSKPRELTNYKGNGYEIAFWSSASARPSQALSGWKRSSGHHRVIISSGIWKRHPWNAMGIGIYKKYAVVWFGEEIDPDGNISICTN